MLTVESCFSGIGGLELGLERTGGFETKWQIEWNDYASKVLEKYWPTVKRYRDIRDVVRPDPVDLICGGYPCQPFSIAGQRKGEEDERHLWPEMYRLIRVLRPRYILLENVPGHLQLGFGRVLGDLAEGGYDAEWQVLSARQLGARHLRRRVFIVAYPGCQCGQGAEQQGTDGVEAQEQNANKPKRSGEALANPTCKLLDGSREARDRREESSDDGSAIPNPDSSRFQEERPQLFPTGIKLYRESNYWATEPDVGRVAHGVRNRVDRLKCIGNAVVPQVAEEIGRMILGHATSNVFKR